MADNVFANGRSILHKGSGGKCAAAMPDVCLCPPPAPTGPVPTPLPNTALASDLDKGAKSVLIDGNPAGNKKSILKTSTGNEASKPTGGGVVSHATKGAAKFTSASFDILIEGEGAVRHADTTTQNHNNPGNVMWMSAAMSAMGSDTPPCGPKCIMVPKDKGCPDGNKTPHHVMPDHCFQTKQGVKQPGFEHYDYGDAPCVCVTGASWHKGQHKRIHDRMDGDEYRHAEAGGWTYEEALECAIQSVMETIGKNGGCEEACLRDAIQAYHDPEGTNGSQPLRCNKARGKEGGKGREQTLLRASERRADNAIPQTGDF